MKNQSPFLALSLVGFSLTAFSEADGGSDRWCQMNEPAIIAFNEGVRRQFSSCDEAYRKGIHEKDLSFYTEDAVLSLAPLAHFHNVSDLSIWANDVQSFETLCRLPLSSLSLSVKAIDSRECPSDCFSALKSLRLTGNGTLIEDFVKGLAHPEKIEMVDLNLENDAVFDVGILNSLVGLKKIWVMCGEKGTSLDFTKFQSHKFGQLTEAMFSGCSLSEGTSFPALRNVEWLRWQSSNITSLDFLTDFFRRNPSLKRLDVDHNKSLSNIGALANLKELNELYLGWTGIADTNLKDVSHLTRLSRLDVNNNDIRGPGITDLASLTNLTILDLDECLIDDEGLKHFQSWPSTSKLKHLRLYYNRGGNLTGRSLDSLQQLTSIQELQICGNQIEDEGLKVLVESLPNLTWLIARENQLSDNGLVNINRLSDLAELNLNGNKKITSGIFQHLGNPGSLKKLHLKETEIDLENDPVAKTFVANNPQVRINPSRFLD